MRRDVAVRIVRRGRLLALVVSAFLAACTQAPVEHPNDVRSLLAETQAAQGPRFAPLGRHEWVSTFGAPQAPIYRIGIGDVLQIWSNADFLKGFGETSSGEVVGTRVKPDGKVYLPTLGAIQAQGRSVIELQTDITQRLKRYKDAPFVSVDLVEPRSQKYYVLGAMAKPGVYPVDGRVTLLEGFSLAGGAVPGADLRNAYVVRDRNVLPVSLADLITRGDTSRNVRMQDGDLVYVPEQKDAAVFVLGEVRQPGPVPMKDGRLSLVSALSAAQGLVPETADQNVVRIFRGGWGNVRSYTLSAGELYAVGEDIGLYPGDRVLVAPRPLATMQRSLVLLQPFITASTSTALTALGVASALDND